MTTGAAAIDGDAAGRFTVNRVQDGAAETVTVRGQVDSTTVRMLSAVVETVSSRWPTSVVVDLSGVTALDGVAASELAEARSRLLIRDGTPTTHAA